MHHLTKCVNRIVKRSIESKKSFNAWFCYAYLCTIMNTYASAESLMFINNRPEKTFVRGEGSWLYDADGRGYLDFVQGWAVNSLGHSSTVVRDALQAQAGRVINVGP